jgi:[ribosomal protein S5]-alanine N-acetyltransferase
LEMYLEEDSNLYIAPLRDKSANQYREFLESKLDFNHRGAGYFFTVISEEGQCIGTANFNRFAALDIEHIGIHLKRAFWAQGYASEVLRALIEFAKTQDRKEIHALVEEEHKVSIAMIEKLGFSLKTKKILKGDFLRIYRLKLDESL